MTTLSAHTQTPSVLAVGRYVTPDGAHTVILSSDCGAYVVRITEDTEHGSVLVSVRSSLSRLAGLRLFSEACEDAAAFSRALSVLSDAGMLPAT